MKKFLISLTFFCSLTSFAQASPECRESRDELIRISRKVDATEALIVHLRSFIDQVKRAELDDQTNNLTEEESLLNSLREDLIELNGELFEVIRTSKEKCQ